MGDGADGAGQMYDKNPKRRSPTSPIDRRGRAILRFAHCPRRRERGGFDAERSPTGAPREPESGFVMCAGRPPAARQTALPYGQCNAAKRRHRWSEAKLYDASGLTFLAIATAS